MNIFYINLAKRTDRRAFMERQAHMLGLKFERVEAVTPDDISDDEITASSGWIGAGELACSYSHRAVWRIIVERDLPAAVVLEDDCVLSRKIPIVLPDKELLTDVELLQLETHPSSSLLGRPEKTRHPDISKRRMLSSSLGSCGYIITQGMARYCMDHPRLPRMDLGKFLFSRDGVTLYEHRVFQAYPALATPVGAIAPESEVKRSDIHLTRRKADPTIPRPRRKTRRDQFKSTIRHLSRAVKAFGLGELLRARYRKIPFAGSAGDAHRLLEN